MAANLSNYAFMGNCRAAEPLHGLIVKWRDAFSSSAPLQQALLGHQAPSLAAIDSAVYHRSIAYVCLEYAEHAIGIATKPPMIMVHQPLVGGLEITAGNGYDPQAIERLQRDWFAMPGTTKHVRDYEGALRAATAEYDLQLVLNLAMRRWNALPRQRFDLDGALKQFSAALDSAYYVQGRSHLRCAMQHAEKLSESPFGRHFILGAQEVHEGIRLRCSEKIPFERDTGEPATPA